MTAQDIVDADNQKVKKIISVKLKEAGLEDVFQKLVDAQFFKAPASVSNHGNLSGGLARHSLMVTYLFTKLLEMHNIKMDEKDVLVCGLMHDLCKTQLYTMDEVPPSKAQVDFLESLIVGKKVPKESISKGAYLSKTYISEVINWLKDDNRGEMPVYDSSKWKHVESKPPLEHSVLSLFMAKDIYPELSLVQASVIRWHMGTFDTSFTEQKLFSEITKTIPEVLLFANADHQASSVYDV